MKLRHPLTGGIYETRDDGLVQVEESGKTGLFHPDGRWHSGALRDADAHLIGWVGGPPRERRGPAAGGSGVAAERATAPAPAARRKQTATAAGARAPGVSYQQLLDADSKPVPDVLRLAVRPRAPGRARPDRALHVARLPRARGGAPLEPRLADGLPRGGDPRGRRPRGLRDRRASRSSSCARRRTRSAPSTTPASTAGGSLRECDGRVDELRCPFHGLTWDLDGALKRVPCSLGLPPRRARRLPAARGEGRHLGRLRVREHGPGRRAPRALPRRAAAALRAAGPSSSATRRPTSPRCCPATGRWRRRPSWRPTTWSPRTRSSCPGIGDANSQYDAWENFSRAITAERDAEPAPRLDAERAGPARRDDSRGASTRAAAARARRA